MNLELLEEIHILQKKGISQSEIASSLGMQKNIFLVCLRMEKIISDKYENVINENNVLIDDFELFKKEYITLEKELETCKSLNEVQLFQEVSDLENSAKQLNIEYNELLNKYDSIPSFIRRWIE